MNMAGFVLYFFLVNIVLTQHSLQDTPPRVQTKLGSMIGTAKETDDGKKIYSFQGIPYIKPPVGELRFRPPQPAEPWTGDFSATSDMAICIQKLFGPRMGSEDCVILNVYTPWDPSSSPPKKPLSVMVFVHGGAFIGGASSTMFGGEPDYLLHHDVILVTINYRLGVLGFLSTEDEAASGNYGLLDQVEALKWVKNNIVHFGGNPDDVTIFGESAGAGSVHLLMMSPLAKGLFHRVIAQSGSSISPWAISRTAGSYARALSRNIGCPEDPSQELVECLRKVDVEKLVDADVVEPDYRLGLLPFIWSPRVDSEAAEPFLPRYPFELMSSGEYNKVPLLIGHTRTEGAGFMVMGEEHYNVSADTMTNNWDHYCKLNLAMRELLVPETTGSKLCEKLKEAYVDSSKEFKENEMAYADLLGDATFMSGIYKSAELMSTHSPVYNYLLNYESKEFYIMKLFIPVGQKFQGAVSHGDDLMYIFKYPQTGWTRQSPEYEMVEMMSKTWTDFAKTGEPSISQLNAPWPKSAWPNHSYVVIDSQPSVRQNYRPEKMKVLDKIYSNFIYKNAFHKREEL